MKKYIIAAAATVMMASTAMALPKAVYIKTNDGFSRYPFSAISGLKISPDGKSLQVGNYGESIKLSDIDYMSFDTPVSETALTPSKQKDRVLAIGREISGKIDLNDHKELVLMVDYFFENGYEEYNVPERYFDKHDVPDEHVPASKMMAKVSDILKSAKRLASGNTNAARQMKAAVTEAWKLDDYYGVYQPDTRNHRWDRISDANGIEARYQAADGKWYSVSITPSGKENQWKENDFTLIWPEHLTVAIKHGDKTLATVDIEIIINQEKSVIDVNLYTDINSYVVSNKTHITNSYATDEVMLTIKGDQIVHSNATLYGAALLDYDRWWADIEASEGDEYYDEETHNWIWVDGDMDGLLGHFSYAKGTVDLLNGKMQIKAHCGNIDKLYRILDVDPEYNWNYVDEHKVIDDAKHTITYIETDLDVLKSHVNAFNNYLDVAYYYDGSNTIEGYLTWDILDDSYDYEDYGYWDKVWNAEYEYWDWVHVAKDVLYTYIYKDYEIEPRLTFSDHSSYALDDEDYFNEDGTSTFVDDYESIIDTYYNIVGRERPHDDDDD